MATNAEPQKPKRHTSRGPKQVMQPIDRIIPTYALSDIEIDALSHNQGNVSLWAAIGSVAAALALGCFWDMIGMEAKDICKSQWGFAVGSIIVSGIAFRVAHYYKSQKKQMISKIKSQLRDLD